MHGVGVHLVWGLASTVLQRHVPSVDGAECDVQISRGVTCATHGAQAQQCTDRRCTVWGGAVMGQCTACGPRRDVRGLVARMAAASAGDLTAEACATHGPQIVSSALSEARCTVWGEHDCVCGPAPRPCPLACHATARPLSVSVSLRIPATCATHGARDQQCTYRKVHGVAVHHVWSCPRPRARSPALR